MKKYIQNIWVRLLACIFCTVSLFGIVLSVVGMFLYAEYSRDELLEIGNERVMENYALYALDHLDTEELDAFFEDINMYITIEKSAYESEDAKTPTITVPYTNMASDLIPTYQMEEVYEGRVSYYSTKSLLTALRSYYSRYNEYTVSTAIEGYVFDVNTGLFYYETSVGYFKADYIYVSSDGNTYDYSLTIKNGIECYYNGYYGIALDPAEYLNWDWVNLSGKRMGISEKYGGNSIQLISDSSLIEAKLRTENYSTDYFSIIYVSKQSVFYTIKMAMKETLVNEDLFFEWQNLVDDIYYYQDDIVGIQWSCILLFIMGVILLVVSAPAEKEKLQFFHRIPVGIYTGLAVAVEGVLVLAIALFVDVFASRSSFTITFENFVFPIMNMTLVMVFIAFVYLATIITRIKTKTFFRYSELYYISRPLVAVYRTARENTSMFWKGLIALAVLTVVQFVVIIACYWEVDVLLGWFFLYKLIEIPLIIYALVQMRQLQDGSKRIASGDLKPIDTSKMFWEFKRHGENINKVREGISLAVEEQMKSERFKTELITNVSHDIKTPLTSIINYVDLIKKEEITDPTMIEYVDVLDRQSARLKKLIEDLIEASKASTGNLEVQLEECDMDVLISQVVGEFEDKFIASGLEVVVTKPEEPVRVMVDGRHMWRVLDNLLNNVCKYSQPNTRVYISLLQDSKEAIITFRNISKIALNIPSDQLMQRFVRGDSSRHTEGSGLGLSIAQSLTELMHGSMKLDIDGDLFKVTLKFSTTL